MRTLNLLPLLLLTAACAVGPGYERPQVVAPETLDRTTEAAEPSSAASLADEGWWNLIEDDVLRSLISEALESGYDVRLAAWRVEEARAQAGIAGSERFPRVDGSLGANRRRDSAFLAPSSATTDRYTVDLGISWEIDLWGRVRHLNEAALARYLSTEEARRGVLLSLVSEVATTYFELRALDAQLEIARRTTDAFEATHSLFDRRLEAGLASSLETSSAAAALASTAAVIPALERRIVANENRLAFLLGRPPGPLARGAALEAQLLPPEIPAGLPSDLLERRPDLRQAEQALRAANAEVGVATADLFPRLSLTGAFGGVAPEVSELFSDGNHWSIGGGLLAPIFQGKRLQEQKNAAVARWEQAKVAYEAAVTSAFGEVSTALVAYQKLAKVEEEQAHAVAAHREAVDRSSSRYLSGLADYLEVLQAQQQLFPAENAVTETRFARLATLVDLYRALGGGWKLADGEWTPAVVAEATPAVASAAR